jgi:hypothetical protein
MPRLTLMQVRQAMEDLKEPKKSLGVFQTFFWYYRGWRDEKKTAPGKALKECFACISQFEAYRRGSMDFTLALAIKRGPINAYNGKFLAGSTED